MPSGSGEGGPGDVQGDLYSSVYERLPLSSMVQPPRAAHRAPALATAASGQERRGFFRVRTELEVSIEAESHVFTATSVNLCPGGVLVSTYRALPRGLLLSIEFDLPASRVVAQGRVRWSREASPGQVPGYGISFTDLSRFDRTLIESFCARLAPEAYPRFAPSRPPPNHRLAG